MSFYTGKYNGKTQCHITSGSHNIQTMRGGVNSATVFHTDVKYVRITPAKLIRHSYEYVHYLTRTVNGKVWYTEYHQRARYRLPSNILSLIRAGYAFFVTSGDYTTGQALKSNINSDTKLRIKTVFYDGTIQYDEEVISWDNGCDGYCYEKNGYLYVHTNSHYVLTLSVLDIKYNGYKDPMTSRFTNEVLINRYSFNVNGIDIAKLKYLSVSNKNSSDSVVNTGTLFKGGSFQLVNTKPTGSGIKFSCKPSTGTQVSVGGNIVIDSRLGTNGFKFHRSGQKRRPAYYDSGAEIVDKFGPIAEYGEIIFFNVQMVGIGSATLIYGQGTTQSQDPRIIISFVSGIANQNGYDVTWWIESGLLTDGGRGTFYTSTNSSFPGRSMPEVRISYVTIK